MLPWPSESLRSAPLRPWPLGPDTQAELRRVQALVRKAKSQPGYQRGWTMALEVGQKDLAITDPALAHTRWSTWMQVKRSEGFFEVRNRTPADLRQQGVAKP